MGYDLHITRAPEHWAANEGFEIAAQEWLALVGRDAELDLAGFNGDYFALWSGPSRHPDPWFNWESGNIETKNPDPPMIEKMLRMAQILAARVQGDDGETYLPGGRIERDQRVLDGPGSDWRTY